MTQKVKPKQGLGTDSFFEGMQEVRTRCPKCMQMIDTERELVLEESLDQVLTAMCKICHDDMVKDRELRRLRESHR